MDPLWKQTTIQTDQDEQREWSRYKEESLHKFRADNFEGTLVGIEVAAYKTGFRER